MEKETLCRRVNALKLELGDNIEILAASKCQDSATVAEAFALGISVFGENKVQEFVDKYTPDYTWDFIGRLQTNKVKYLVGKVRYIQSVDRMELATTINKEAKKKNIVQQVLVEINMGKEEEKGGVFAENAESFIKEISSLNYIKVRGIMVVMPQTEDENKLDALYAEARCLFDNLKNILPDIDVFSGGMSGDYKIAARHNVTQVRLGRALFGDRVYK